MIDYCIFASLVFIAFSGFMGYIWGNSKKGQLVHYTNELPNGFMRVVSIDKKSAVLEEINAEKNRFLVTSDAFGGKPIRPNDLVRKMRNEAERKKFNLPVLGYPPLVKDTIEEEN